MFLRSDPAAPPLRKRLLPRTALPLIALMALLAPWAQAQEVDAPAASAEEIRAAAEELFQIVPGAEGLLLEPREEIAGIASIQIAEGQVRVDGDLRSEEELRELIGEAAGPVLGLAALEPDRLLSLFGEPAPGEPAPPAAPERPRRPRRPRGARSDAQVVIGDSVTIEADEVARDVVVFGGTLTILGRVEGDAVVIGGSARVEGEVEGDMAVIGGSVKAGPTAEIGGDLVTVGGSADVSEEAYIGGEVVGVPFGPSLRFGTWDTEAWDWRWSRDRHRDWWDTGPVDRIFGVVWRFIGITLLILLACFAYLVARRPVERIERRVKAEPWKSGLVGLVTQILFLPVLILVIVILCISIIGIPLLLLVPFALVAALLLAFLGYTAVALALGRWSEGRFGWSMVNPYVAVVVGLALIQVWHFFGHLLNLGGGPLKLLALIFLIFGFLVKYLAWTIGIGGALLTRFGTSEGWSGGAQAALPPTPRPPEAPPPSDWERPQVESDLPEPGPEPESWEPEEEPRREEP